MRLFRRPPDNEDALPAYYFEQYRLATEMADRVSARRATANGYFATLLTGLAAIVALVQPYLVGAEEGVVDWTRLVVGGIGLVISLTWWFALRSYRRLNDAKFDVIVKMETRLPVAVFGDEWEFLRGAKKPWYDRYHLLSGVERVVPLAFVTLFGAILFWPWVEIIATWAAGLLS